MNAGAGRINPNVIMLAQTGTVTTSRRGRDARKRDRRLEADGPYRAK
jgi:hypothetical protein